MKYQVQIKYTNPAHEHVSLRRRVDTVTRLVEASTETEAINRAANQQRALGFKIQEAAIVAPESEEKGKKKKKVVGDEEQTDIAAAGGVKEGFDPEPSDIAAQLIKKHGKGKVTKDHVDAYEKDRDSNKGIDKEAVMKHVKKMSEEVVTEASREAKDVMRGLRASLKSMDLRHGVDSDKREAGYKMSPAVKAAQKKSDILSRIVKRPQAGTLAATRAMQKEDVQIEYIEEKLTAADPASKWIHDFVASDNPKFAGKSKKERIQMALGAHYAAKRAKNEEKEVKHSKKSADAAEVQIDNDKKKTNKINMEPALDIKINNGVK